MRYDILKQIVSMLQEEYVICNIGIPSKELHHLKDRPRNFYMLGSMGLASSIALGVAIAQPEKRVWSVDGDGSLLMNLGCLATIANVNPANLTLLVIDNGAYGSTGSQKTYTRYKTKLDVVAKGAGFKPENIHVLSEPESLPKKLTKLREQKQDGAQFILIKTEPGNKRLPRIDMEAVDIKIRFMNDLKKE